MKIQCMFYIFIMSITMSTYGSTPQLSNFFECSLAVSRFTNQVHRRFYFIERLKKTMQMLAKINERIDQLSFLVRTIMKERYAMNYSFSHARIQTSVEEIIKTKSLTPLFMIWDDFTIYKSLDDDLFVEEFTKEIFIVTKGLLNNYIGSSPTFKRAIKHLNIGFSHDTIYETLGGISAMADILVMLSDYGEAAIYKLMEDVHRDELVDLVSEVTSEDVLIRFYHMERLQAHSRMFNLFASAPLNCFKSLPQSVNNNDQAIFDDEFEFSSPVVRRVIKKMERKNDVQPLLRLLDDLKQFKYIDNDPFVREVIIALFLTQKNYVINMSIAHDNTKNMDNLKMIIQAYNAIEDLPIEEILEVMDVAVNLYKELAQEEEYAFGWRDIFTSNWIVRAASLAMFITRIISLLPLTTSEAE